MSPRRIKFLTVEDVLAIHEQALSYGGEAGVLSSDGVESAVAMPQAGISGEYFHKDAFEMAAAYLYHLALNHAFLDGNKRTAIGAVLVFLDLNKIGLRASQDDLYLLTVTVARGEASKERIARTFRKWAKAATVRRPRRSR